MRLQQQQEESIMLNNSPMFRCSDFKSKKRASAELGQELGLTRLRFAKHNHTPGYKMFSMLQ